jgi:hypothetical protein
MYSVSAIAGFFGCLIACPSRFARGVRSWFRSRSRLVTEADCVSTLAIAFSLSYFYHADCHVALWKLLEPLLLRFFSSIDRALRPRRSTQNVADHSGFAPMTKTRSSTSPLPPPAAASYATRHAILTPLLQLRYSRPFERVFCSGTRPQTVSFTDLTESLLALVTSSLQRPLHVVALDSFDTFHQRRLYSNYLVRFSFTLVATLSRRAPEACQHVAIVTAAHFRFFSTVDRFSPSKFPTSLLRTCRREQSLCSDGENIQFYCTASTASCRSSRQCHVSAPTALPTQDSSIYSIRPFHEAARIQRCATKSLGFVSSPESVSCKSCYLKLT